VSTDAPHGLPFATEETYLHATDLGREEALATLLTIVLGQEFYGLPTESVREIIKVGAITEVPRLPRFLLGVISVRGAIIPVIDLRRRLALDEAPLSRAAPP
jgi:purine-binding chemotaxis protein CheW